MRLHGITARLFLAMLGVTLVAVLTMVVATQYTFQDDFLDYARERQQERIAALVGTLGVASVAQARPHHGPGHGPGMVIQELPAEVSALMEHHSGYFPQADANGDGQLNAGELNAAIERMRAERRLQRLDANHDGTVSADEFSAPLRKRLQHMDRNDDGTIDGEEAHPGHKRHGKHHGREDDNGWW